MPRRKLSEEEKKQKFKQQMFEKILNNEELTITQVAKLVNKKSVTIRKWEQLGIVHKPRIVNKVRRYNRNELCVFMHDLLQHDWKYSTIDKEMIQQIADYLKQRSAVVVNLKRVTPDQAKRIVDFLSGTIYAIGGELQKLGGGIFLCTPNNVKVAGKISEEANNASSANKNVKAKKDKEDSDEDDFF